MDQKECIRKNISRLEKVQMGYKGEQLVAKLVGGQTTPHTAVMDVLIPGDGAVEVKSQHVLAKKYACRMEREALTSKLKWAKTNKAKVETYMTIIDDTVPNSIIAVYKKAGVGNFDVQAMEFVGSYDQYGKPLGIKFDKFGKRITELTKVEVVNEVKIEQGVSGFSEKTFGQLNYRGIKRVSYDNTGDKAIAIQNAKDIDDALSKIPQRYLDGLNSMYVTGGGAWIGSAVYIPISKLPGYASDEIMLMGGWLKKDSAGRAKMLLHEIGHRVQNVTDKIAFKEFDKRNLGRFFKDVTDPQFVVNYKKNHYAGETFAESFARYYLKIDQPKELQDFWKEFAK